MKDDMIADMFRAAQKNGCERWKCNIDEILDYVTENTDPNEVGTLLVHISEVGCMYESIENTKDLHRIVVVAIRMLVNNKDTILKLMEAPELEVSFA